MKLRKNKWRYPAPTIGEILSVAIDRSGHYFMVMQVKPEEIAAARKKAGEKAEVIGMPVMMAYAEDTFMLYPTPDSDFECRVRYYPPAVEI